MDHDFSQRLNIPELINAINPINGLKLKLTDAEKCFSKEEVKQLSKSQKVSDIITI